MVMNPTSHHRSLALRDALSNALCACIISYCVVSFIAGQAGLLAYRDLESGIEQMNGRIGQLVADNQVLQNTRNALASDADRIAREARDIGYIHPGEKIVSITPASENAASYQRYPDIEPLRAGSSTGLPDPMIKTLAAMTGITVLFVSLFMAIVPGNRKKAPD